MNFGDFQPIAAINGDDGISIVLLRHDNPRSDMRSAFVLKPSNGHTFGSHYNSALVGGLLYCTDHDRGDSDPPGLVLKSDHLIWLRSQAAAVDNWLLRGDWPLGTFIDKS